MVKLILSFKGKILDEYILTAGQNTIGSAPDCTIHIDSLAIAPVHAHVTVMDGEYSVREHDPEHPVIVNHRRTANTQLKHDDIILLGKHMFRLVIEEDAPQAEVVTEDNTEKEKVSRAACLQIMTGQNVGKTIRLTNAVTNIGKRGIHTASIARRSDGYYLTHLEGDNPTRVAGKEVLDETCLLDDGNIIELGVIKMQFYLE